MVASAPGVVYLTNDEVQKQQYVRAGTELMVILPTNTSGIIGKINLAPNGSGKVRAGQKVVVKFDSYPFPEFGAVFGEVFKKGKSLTGEEVPIDVVFPKGLITTTGNKLEPAQGMTGKVEIITEEKRFLEWIFERFRKVSDRYISKRKGEAFSRRPGSTCGRKAMVRGGSPRRRQRQQPP